MSEQQQENPTRRFGADGEETAPPSEPTSDVIVASVPGDDESKFVTIALSHPLNERDRIYLGLPADASTEVGQKVRVNRNGAKAVINAGYAMIDPEDTNKVQAVLRGQSGDSGEPTGMRTAEVRDNPLDNPPQAATTPATPGPNAPQPGQAPGNTDGSQPSAEGDGGQPVSTPAKGKGR